MRFVAKQGSKRMEGKTCDIGLKWTETLTSNQTWANCVGAKELLDDAGEEDEDLGFTSNLGVEADDWQSMASLMDESTSVSTFLSTYE